MRRPTLAVATQTRCEGRYLREWLEYHFMLGAAHAYVVNDEFDPVLRRETHLLLARYALRGLVTELPGMPDRQDAQMRDWQRVVRAWGYATTWLWLTDVDAFLYPVLPEVSVLAYLERADQVGDGIAALAVYGATFGAAGRETPPELQTRDLLYRAETAERCNWTANFILRAEGCLLPRDGDHVLESYIRPAHNCYLLDENMQRLPLPKPGKRPGPQGILRYNHYPVRSEQDWSAKVLRGWDHATLGDVHRLDLAKHKRAMYDRNDVYDPGMLRFTDELARRLGLEAKT